MVYTLRMPETSAPKPRPTYSLPCICTHEYDTSGRFPVWRITEYRKDCVEHGWQFSVNVASILRYGD